ncbi:MAG: amino acid racemase, partial [Victivallaceae bacterium]
MKRAAIGIVGGFCPLAVADIYLKAMKQVKAVRGDYDYPDIIISAALEQKVRGDWFDDSFERRYDMSHRSLYIYQVARELKSRGVDKILVPDFLSCNFIKTISNNLEIPFIDIVEVIACEVKNKWPRTSRVGLLAATLAIESKVFNTKFAAKGLEIIYPDKDVQENMIMKAVYGPAGLKRGIIDKRPGKLIHRACEHLLTKGAEIIVSGITELPLIDKAYYPENRYLDCNDVIAGELINNKYIIKSNLEKRRIIGILGGVGPAATVDIFDKIVKNTPAVKDQDHLKIIIENNPQIPDRTAALYDKGEDPGIAILAGAEKLQDAGADFVIVPCNTAHVFLEKIQK